MKSIKGFALTGCLLAFLACNNKNNEFDATGVFETTEIIVSAEANGKIMSLNVEEGQQVRTGAPLGYIDTIQLHLQKMQLLANNKAVQSRHSSIPLQIAATQQQIATQKKERDRFERLVQADVANQKQLDDINAQIYLLEKQLAAQTETLQNTNRGITEESTGIEVQVAQLEDQIRKSVIQSPIDGTILTKYAEEGELVTQGKALFKVADTENMFLRAYIIASQLTEIKVGQAVQVFSDFGEEGYKEYTGTVSWISDKAEFTPKTIQTRDERANLVYAVKIAVKNDGYIKSGMYGEIKLQ